MASPLPPPNRVTVAHSTIEITEHKEPGVDVLVDTLEVVPIMEGLKRARVASHASVPASNNEPGRPTLEDVPGSGIVIPGGANIYYLDIAPSSTFPMHRTQSTDYLVIVKGTLTVIAPPAPFDVIDGKGSYTETAEVEARQGDVVVQRGTMHTFANRTKEWVRVLGIVLGAEPIRIGSEELGESWLQ